MLDSRQTFACAQAVAALGAAARLHYLLASPHTRIGPHATTGLWIALVLALSAATAATLTVFGSASSGPRTLECTAAFYLGCALMTGLNGLDQPPMSQLTGAGIFLGLAAVCLSFWCVHYKPFHNRYPYREDGR